MALTAKQEKFANLVVELSNQSEAYRQAYDCENSSVKSVNELACREANKVHVASRIQEIRDDMEIKVMWRRINSVETLKGVATSPEKQSDAVNAVKALNAMFGWDKQVLDHTSSDGTMSPTKEMTDDDFKEQLQKLGVDVE